MPHRIRETILALAFIAISTACHAADQNVDKPKPYPLDTCLVCGMKLSEMGKPYVLVYKGQEIKVCDKSEKADFDKDRAKYIKKLEAARAKAKK